MVRRWAATRADCSDHLKVDNWVVSKEQLMVDHLDELMADLKAVLKVDPTVDLSDVQWDKQWVELMVELMAEMMVVLKADQRVDYLADSRADETVAQRDPCWVALMADQKVG